MLQTLTPFLIHWAIIAFSLWVASHLFRGIRFDTTGALAVSALLLGFANAVVKPLLIVLTLPLTLLTFGLFLLVINAGMLMLTGWLAEQLDVGFRVDGFWPAVGGSIVITIVMWIVDGLIGPDDSRR